MCISKQLHIVQLCLALFSLILNTMKLSCSVHGFKYRNINYKKGKACLAQKANRYEILLVYKESVHQPDEITETAKY